MDRSKSPTLYLEVIRGNTQRRQWFPRRGRCYVGRHADCDLVLTGDLVSRKHVQIDQDQDRLFVEDLKSRNGTRVNYDLIETRTELHAGDQLEIGDFLLEVRESLRKSPSPANPTLERSTTIISSMEMDPNIPQTDQANHEQKLQAVLDVARSLGESLDEQSVLPKVLKRLLGVLPQTDRAAIFLLADGSPEIQQDFVQLRDGCKIPSVLEPVSRTLLEQVLAERKAILSSDTISDDRFSHSESLESLGVRSMMCVPLEGPDRKLLGVLQTESYRGNLPFTDRDLDVLRTLAQLIARMIEHNRLSQRMITLDRRQRDLAVARDVQKHFLPAHLPKIPGYRFYHHYQAAEEVGGDYFDYMPLRDGKLAITQGDVSGHGVAAALLMARLCSENRYSLGTESNLDRAVTALNEQFQNQLTLGRFITFVACALDPVRHEMIFVNAGHPAPLICRSNGVVEAVMDPADSGPPLGVVPGYCYHSVRVAIQPGEAVVMVTDGITEAGDSKDSLFGEARLKAAMERAFQQANPDENLAELIGQRVEHEVSKFSDGAVATDDQCLVCFFRESENKSP